MTPLKKFVLYLLFAIGGFIVIAVLTGIGIILVDDSIFWSEPEWLAIPPAVGTDLKDLLNWCDIHGLSTGHGPAENDRSVNTRRRIQGSVYNVYAQFNYRVGLLVIRRVSLYFYLDKQGKLLFMERNDVDLTL